MRLRIKEERTKRGWTVDDLAAKVGLSRSYVSEIENGRKNVNGARLDAFANAFGCSPIELIDDASVGEELMQHLSLLRKLSPEDRDAVIRHALALAVRDKPL